MVSILKKIFDKQTYIEQKNSEEKKDYYQKELLQQYGKYVPLHTSLPNWLFISDTHGTFHTEELKNIDLSEYRSVILLGDHTMNDLDRIARTIPKYIPIYGLLGNHDEKIQYDVFNRFADRHIYHIGNTVTVIDGIKVAAFDGSFRYKPTESLCMYTQEEMIRTAELLMSAQVIFSHSNPYLEETHDKVHEGMKAITKYAYENHVPYIFHGHTHSPGRYSLENNTTCTCVYHLHSTKL